MKKTVKTLVIGSMLLLFAFLSMRSCEISKLKDENNSLKADLFRGEQEFRKERDKSNRELSYQKTLVMERDKELEKEILKNSNLSKINSSIVFQYETLIENIKTDYSSVEYIYDSIEVPIGVKFGTNFEKKDEWFSLGGKIDEDGLFIDSLSILNKFTVNIGYEREKWFKKPVGTVEIISENPYVYMNKINNVNFKDKDRLINKPWFTFLIGTVTGSALTTAVILSK